MTARTTRRIAVIAAGLSQPSSTRLLADRLVEATRRRLADDGVEVEVSVLELRDVATDITNNMLTGFASPRLDAEIQKVVSADALIAVTPIFTTSYSGLFKSFIDILQPDSLTGMPVLIGATGGLRKRWRRRRSRPRRRRRESTRDSPRRARSSPRWAAAP